MREGKVYIKDYDDALAIHRAEGAGFKVVCVSHFPARGVYGPEMFAKMMDGVTFARRSLAFSTKDAKGTSEEPETLAPRILSHAQLENQDRARNDRAKRER